MGTESGRHNTFHHLTLPWQGGMDQLKIRFLETKQMQLHKTLHLHQLCNFVHFEYELWNEEIKQQ